jgi:hypothetical protein
MVLPIVGSQNVQNSHFIADFNESAKEKEGMKMLGGEPLGISAWQQCRTEFFCG